MLIDLIPIILRDALLAGTVSGGFAVIFNTPRKLLVWCVLAGMTGKAARTVLMTGLGLEVTISTLIGATAVGFMAYFLARHVKAPASVFGLAGCIPLVPGVFAFEALLEIIRYTSFEPGLAIELLIKTSFVLGGLAIGISVPTLLFDRTKPVV
jgi:uncharacterized membrane protein YjjB (DUF3815 family)